MKSGKRPLQKHRDRCLEIRALLGLFALRGCKYDCSCSDPQSAHDVTHSSDQSPPWSCVSSYRVPPTSKTRRCGLRRKVFWKLKEPGWRWHLERQLGAGGRPNTGDENARAQRAARKAEEALTRMGPRVRMVGRGPEGRGNAGANSLVGLGPTHASTLSSRAPRRPQERASRPAPQRSKRARQRRPPGAMTPAPRQR